MDWLLFRLECAPTTFQNPPPIEHDSAAFRMSLRDGKIRFDFKDHYASVQAAQDSLNDFLRAWEIDVGLRLGPGKVRFVYENARVTERDPPPPGEPVEVGLEFGLKLGLSVSVSISLPAYPEPPKAFRITPTVETLWLRYEGYLAKREPLPSMAYFCLTVVENSVGQRTGKRKAAAAKYSIHVDVLNKLGEITERRGDQATARKMDIRLLPHTPREVEWIEATVKAIIRRVAEVEARASVQHITIGDLPAL